MRNETGQTLIELTVALGIFIIVISVLVYLILNSYVAGRLASEITQANFLAEEGLETARSIRDNNWQGLTGETTETIDGKFTRTIKIEEIDSDRKKITSRVSWQFTEQRSQEVKLVTHLTNWQKMAPGVERLKPTAHTDILGRTTNPGLAYDEPNGTTWATTVYRDTGDSITFHTWQMPTKSYTNLVLKYRYHADSATDDKYGVAYSTTGCSGAFTYLISPTSIGAPDTTVSAGLSPSQDLSQLCLKINSEQIRAPDSKNLYTRDIWTEGF
jgi:type II secretory pathway pseudopilin PulG